MRQLITALVLCLPVSTFAQSAGGVAGISGVVRDQSGAVVVGARVVAEGKSYKRSTTTSASGDFRLESVPLEAILLLVDAPGFRHFQTTFSPDQTSYGLDILRWTGRAWVHAGVPAAG